MPRTEGARTAPLEIKLAAMRMLDRGMKQKDVADALGYSPVAIWKWREAYKKLGAPGLERRPMTGRPRKLNDRELKKLVFYLAKGPTAYGFKNDIWTLKRITFVIRKEFGVKYHPGHVWKLLQRLGFSRQKPERRAIERNDKEVERWRKKVWPQYRRRTKNPGITMAFLDESGRSEIPTVVATWAPKGKTPTLRHLFRWEKCSIVSAITPAGKLHYRLYLSSIRSEHVVSLLNHLLRKVQGKVLLFLDNGPIHRSKAVRDFLRKNRDRIQERWLPSYAPDLNPVEQVYKRLKYVETANNCPMNVHELLQETRLALERIRKRPKLMPSFFEHAGLSLNMGKLIN